MNEEQAEPWVQGYVNDLQALGRAAGKAFRKIGNENYRILHRAAMVQTSKSAGHLSPRYYITRTGPETRPWRVERVSIGTLEVIGEHRSHAEALAQAHRWARSYRTPRRWAHFRP